MRGTDAAGLVTGVGCLILAALGLWVSFDPAATAALGVAIPVALVLVGVTGLLASRNT